MLKRPRLRYSYLAEFLDRQVVVLSSEKSNAILSNKLYNRVLSEIEHDGVLVDELVTRLAGEFSAIEIYLALNELDDSGYLTETAPSAPSLAPEMCAYWDSLGIDADRLPNLLEEKPVSLEVIGLSVPGAVEAFTQAFDAAGIKTADIKTGGTGVIKVVVTDDYRREEFREINRKALDTGCPWMPVKPVGTELWIGPLFLPGKTGCWECLKQRLDIRNPIDTFYKTQKNTGENLKKPVAALPLSIGIAAGHVAVQLVKWLYFGENRELEGRLITCDTQTAASRSHVLVKRPQCLACGDPDEKPAEFRPLILKRKSSYCIASRGGYRDVSPEDTLEKYGMHVSPITGVVQELKPYHSVPGAPIYNYLSGHNIAFRSKTLFWMNQHIRSASGGKGKTWSQAKTGALCEAVERYSITYHGDESCITASLKDLKDDGIHPNTCMNYSAAQYRDRERINRECDKFYNLVPVPFDESLQMHWTPVYSLSQKRFKYLPSCFCYAQYPAEDERNLFSYPDSNGSAAGNSLEEAALQGFLELVERDSVALWWYNMIRRPAVDLASFDNPYFSRLIDYYRSLDRSLYVLDLTADLGIPVFGAVSHRHSGEKKNGEKENIIFGFGAHVDAGIAVERALVELNQILPAAGVPGNSSGQGRYLTRDKNFVDWLDTATMENQPYLVPLENVPAKTAADYPRLSPPNIYDSLIFCIDTAGKHGLETLVLDVTRKDVGLPVVRVIVPGMRHFWRRLAPGRLYDVPIKLGWLDKPLSEEKTNPVGLFI
jgi:bacteriocin biosynthesis cyclodehydratase domain-containing protein